MASSGDSNYADPPQGPSPPANMIAPQGQSAPFSPHFINFLGNTNTPSTGLTPEMLAAIAATNGPPPGVSAATSPTGLQSGADIAMRNQLAAQMVARKNQALAAYQTPERGYNVARGGGSGHGAGGGMGGGWGGH